MTIMNDGGDNVDINKTWKNIRRNINTSPTESLGYYVLKQHKLRFHEACSKLSDQRKHAKLQWLQYLSQTN